MLHREGSRKGAETRPEEHSAGRDQIVAARLYGRQATHDLEEHPHATGCVQAIKNPDLLSERSCRHPHALPALKLPEGYDTSMIGI